MEKERLKKQFAFIREVDKEKFIGRQRSEEHTSELQSQR